MRLVMLCRTADAGGFKANSVLPIEYKSKAALLKDFMKIAISSYKKLKHNYGRGAYFVFLGRRYEACDYYHIFSDRTTLSSPPTVMGLEEWYRNGRL